MKLSELDDWLSLAANIGVLIGLVALVIELNQSTRMAEVTAFETRITGREQSRREQAISGEMSEIIFTAQTEGIEALSPLELFRYRTWASATMLRQQSQYYQYQQGFLDRSIIDSTINGIVSISYKRWNDLGILDLIEIPELRAEIDQRAAELESK